jgi:hypothetical protein
MAQELTVATPTPRDELFILKESRFLTSFILISQPHA